MSEKTEQPSPRRLREAREKGDLARSKPLAAAGASLLALGTLTSLAPDLAAGLLRYGREALAAAASDGTSPGTAGLRALLALAAASLPVLAAAWLGALAGAGLQVGALVNAEALLPKSERLSPAAGFARVFSKKSLLEVLKAAGVALVVLWLAFLAAREAAPAVARLALAPAFGALAQAAEVSRGFCLHALGFALAFGALDYLLERRGHVKKLMMSREELKQEHKNSEGDPHHKAKRKQAHRSLLNGTTARGVQRANVVVLNPTHVAVALRYEPNEAAAPTIVAKGVDEEAARIRALARRFKVPMVRDVPLARTLVRYDLGEEIPEELYQAAAAVLSQVYALGADGAPNPRSPR